MVCYLRFEARSGDAWEDESGVKQRFVVFVDEDFDNGFLHIFCSLLCFYCPFLLVFFRRLCESCPFVFLPASRSCRSLSLCFPFYASRRHAPFSNFARRLSTFPHPYF